MPLPEYGKWRLKHPLIGANPPFVTLEVDLVNKTGVAWINMKSYPLLQVLPRAGDSTFLARYKVDFHHGMLEAIYQSDQSLNVEFSGGTVETTCTGQLLAARGLIQGVPSATPPAAESTHLSFTCAGDIARAFDGLVDENSKQIQHWCNQIIEKYPGAWWAVGLGKTIVDVPVFLGQGMVDTLRFGEGIAEGGFKGFGKDALRFISLVGPLGRAGGTASRFLTPLLQSGRLRFAVQVAGVEGPCTFQAINNAASITRGKSLFITVSDMAAAVGKRLSQLTKTPVGRYDLAAWVDELVPFLRQNGMRVKEITGCTRVEQVIELARKETGPVVFAIRTTVKQANGCCQEILHSVTALRTPLGSVRFADYGGKFVGSLAELVSKWGTPISDIELLQNGSSATIINGARLTGEWAVKFAKGTFLVLQDLRAIETQENGFEFAVPANCTALRARQP